MAAQALDRAKATLIAGALGDALGMPTQLYSAHEIAERYGFVEDFVPPADDHPISRGLAAGTITDDTEQTLLLARRLLLSPERFDHAQWVADLLVWERDVKARGSYDLLGPSTKRAIDAINDGVSAEMAGRGGDTNGAAMRIAPVGIATPAHDLAALVARVAQTCLATHNSPDAISSAAAVAAAVSAGVAGGTWRDGQAAAVDAACLAREAGFLEPGRTPVDMAGLIEGACAAVRGLSAEAAIAAIVRTVGTSVAAKESVPAAFAVLAVAEGDPWQAACLGANLGGDTDTIAAIAATMAGACAGMAALPGTRIAALRGLDLAEVETLAGALVSLRQNAQGGKQAA